MQINSNMINKNLLIFSFILVLGTTVTCSSRKGNSLDESTYSLLNDFFARQEMPCFCAKGTLVYAQFQPWNIPMEDLNDLTEFDSIFSKDDIVYLKEQFLNTENDVIEKNRIKNGNIFFLDDVSNKSQKAFWDNLVAVHRQTSYNTVSRPLFSRDQQKAIISIRSHGFDSTFWGAVYIFVKVKNV